MPSFRWVSKLTNAYSRSVSDKTEHSTPNYTSSSLLPFKSSTSTLLKLHTCHHNQSQSWS